MIIKIGINGLGRIGRLFARRILENEKLRNEIQIIQINGVESAEKSAYFLKFDSNHGIFKEEIKILEDNQIEICERKILISNEREISKIKWDDEIDLIVECSGKFNSKKQAEKHFLNSNAKNIIISAPCEEADETIIFGVNSLKKNSNIELKKVISVGSCTTNALLPIIKMIHEIFGIKNGFFSTIHAFTNDQLTLDGNHKDLRRGRAASVSIIPTKTGANQLISQIFPELDGKISGSAIRVPVQNVSLIDLKVNLLHSDFKDKDDLILKIKDYINSNEIKNILGFTDLPLVSIDFNGNEKSSTIDLLETKIIEKDFIRILSWYDNEWGFVCRMTDVIKSIFIEL